MRAVARHQEDVMKLLRERGPAGTAAVVGVALALPSVVAPTWRLTTLDSARGVVLFDQHDWSWGRSQLVGADGSTVQDLWNPFGLAVLVVLLVLAAAGAVAWLLTTSRSISVAAAVASAALLGRMSTTVADRLGRTVRDDVHGLAATGASTSAGALETLAAAVLLVAVALMVASVAGWRLPDAWVARLRALAAGGPAEPAEPAGSPDGVRAGPSSSVGVRATIVSRPEGEHLASAPVGFDDGPAAREPQPGPPGSRP
jgi:hypothetical protein